MRLLRTDLAVECTAQYHNNLPQGVSVEEYETAGGIVTRVCINSPQAAEQLGRAQGHYITLELPDVADSVDPADECTRQLAREISSLLPEQGLVLVVGLGNIQMTPDALGPKTIRQIFSTRHIPDQVRRQTGLEGLRPVAAIAPGVLGQTGIETSEIIRSIAQQLAPQAIIVVDALASRSLARLGRTVQLSDSGISPGSGVFNSRQELSRETLHVPVVSIGIPTVVDGETLARDLLGNEDESKVQFPPAAAQMMVTPRDIDSIIQRGAKQLSLSINCALQPRLSPEELTYLIS